MVPNLVQPKDRKEKKAGVLAHGKLVDSVAADLRIVIEPHEDRLRLLKEAEEQRIEIEKAEARRIENDRVAKHRENVEYIRNFPTLFLNRDADSVVKAINTLEAKTLEGFEEFRDQAEAAKMLAISTLEDRLAAINLEVAEAAARQKAADELAEQQRIAAEEQAAQQKKLDDQQAELDRQKQEMADHQAQIDKEAKDRADAERQRMDDLHEEANWERARREEEADQEAEPEVDNATLAESAIADGGATPESATVSDLIALEQDELKQLEYVTILLLQTFIPEVKSHAANEFSAEIVDSLTALHLKAVKLCQ